VAINYNYSIEINFGLKIEEEIQAEAPPSLEANIKRSYVKIYW